MPDATLSLSTIRDVRDSCLCLATQRAARRLARRFDRAFHEVGLTNNQFSALMFIAATGQTPGRLADLMAMDPTTVTALLKALARNGWIESAPGEDRRVRLLTATSQGRARLAEALPIWRREHARLESELPEDSVSPGRAFLAALAAAPLPDAA